MNLTLGPILYYWPREDVIEFYREVADWPVERVYLGEVVCSRRHQLRLDDWLEVAANLRAAGKDVVLSCLALIESEADLKGQRRGVASDFPVEANDMGAVRLAAAAGRPFVAGPHVNTYNPRTLALLGQLGANRWVMPTEMSRQSLAGMMAAAPAGIETEVFVYGRIPLAFSARCFTARHHNLPKDDCQFRCLDYPNGLSVKTREGQPFLALNGIQTQSALVYNLIGELDAMRDLGVAAVRISPQAHHTGKIVDIFRARLAGEIDVAEARARLAKLMPEADCDGYWFGRPGLERSAAQGISG